MSRLPEPLRDHGAEATLFVRRSIIAAVVVVLLFGVLAFNLYHLQVEEHEQYQTRSNANDIKTLPIAPVRGLSTTAMVSLSSKTKRFIKSNLSQVKLPISMQHSKH